MTDLKRILRLLPKAVWEALMQACKVNPVTTFGLTTLEILRDGVKEIEPKDRVQLAEGLKEAPLVELISAIQLEMTCTDEKGKTVAEVVAKILSGYARYGELEKGIEPTLIELLT